MLKVFEDHPVVGLIVGSALLIGGTVLGAFGGRFIGDGIENLL